MFKYKNYDKLLDDARQLPLLERTLEWARVNSGSSNLDGLSQMAAMLGKSFSLLDGDLHLIDPEPEYAVDDDGKEKLVKRGQHLLLTIRPDAPRQMLFTGHMDTVFPADSEFQTITAIKDGILNGPGLADMKGGISVMLGALELFERSNAAAQIGYQVVINSDEETGSKTSRSLIAQCTKGKFAAFTYEPAALPDGTLAGARGGSGNFAITVHGKAAHAGRNPDDGRNALVAAADIAVALKKLHRPGLSVNPARIAGGGPNNVVPDLAILYVNFRPLLPEDQKDAEQALKEISEKIAHDHNVSLRINGDFGRPPKPMNQRTQKLFELVQECGKELGQHIDWRSTGGVCDGNNIAACGIPVVDTMGVRGGSIHSPDEFLICDSLVERVQLSALSILRLAQKEKL